MLSVCTFCSSSNVASAVRVCTRILPDATVRAQNLAYSVMCNGWLCTTESNWCMLVYVRTRNFGHSNLEFCQRRPLPDHWSGSKPGACGRQQYATPSAPRCTTVCDLDGRHLLLTCVTSIFCICICISSARPRGEHRVSVPLLEDPVKCTAVPELELRRINENTFHCKKRSGKHVRTGASI